MTEQQTPTHLAISIADWNKAWDDIGNIVGITPNAHRAAMQRLGSVAVGTLQPSAPKPAEATAEAKE